MLICYIYNAGFCCAVLLDLLVNMCAVGVDVFVWRGWFQVHDEEFEAMGNDACTSR